MSFGEKLKKLRIEKGLSQWGLAKKLGYASNGYIAEIERGEYLPSEKNLRRIAKALDVPYSKMEDLLFEAKLEDLGIKPELIAMYRETLKLPKEEQKAIIKAYLKVKAEREKKS